MTSLSPAFRRATPGPTAAGWLGPWVAVAAMAVWTASPGGAPLSVAAAGLVAGVLLSDGGTRLRSLGTVLVLAGILTGFLAHRQVGRLASGWDAYWDAREARVEGRLGTRLETRLQAAEAAADELAQVRGRAGEAPREGLSDLRRRHEVTALAFYGPDGALLDWDGVHRGKVPEEVQRGLRRYAFGDLPLFGYLYVTAPAGATGTAVAAILLRTGLPEPLASTAGDFGSEFQREVGEAIRIVPPEAEGVEGGWDFQLGNRTLFTVLLDTPSPETRARDILSDWRVRVGALLLVAWLLLALGEAPRLAGGAVAALTLLVLAATLPLQELGGLAPLFHAGGYHAFRVPASLGRLAALALAAVTVISVAPRPRIRLPTLAVGAVAALLVPAVLVWAGASQDRMGLAEGQAAWIVYQGMVSIVLTLALGTVLTLARQSGEGRLLGLAGVGLASALGAGAAAWVWSTSALPVGWLALWGVPVAMAARSLGGWAAWRAPVTWLLAGLLAGTATVPATWAHRVDARRQGAVATLGQLATPDDPVLEQALLRLGREARALAAAGERGVDLLYGAWRASGLDVLGAPAWLTLWSPGGVPAEELRVGMGERPEVATPPAPESPPDRPIQVVRFDRDDARYLLRVSLAGGGSLTAAAPPFADPTARSPLSPLLAGGMSRAAPPLTLIPHDSGYPQDPEGVAWVRTDQGWRAELPLAYPNGTFYQAQYAVSLPGTVLAVARAALLVLLSVGLFLTFWIVGRGLLRDVIPGDFKLSGLVISFRARVTLALFGFFVLAIAIFGTVAYRTIAGTSRRAAQVLAERVAEDASGWYFEVGGQMQALARRVGAELLEYRDGELREGSVEELVELGLYEGWLPRDVARMLDRRETVRELTETTFGEWEYVTAFRRLPDGDVLAAQVPLQAGATAIRSADVAQLLGFAVVLGAALSLGLALLVGRALTSPIHALQVASERVGAGNLGLRLPGDRADEFGSVFSAFNRMVARLRRARRQLVRTSRRTQAIMEEAAVGMVALDSDGLVTLVNPRAVGLLEAEVRVGEPFPSTGPMGVQLADWLKAFLASGAEEADVELHPGERRVHVRARRLGVPGARGGAVVAMEDVTDQLRAERVLAWGEMARQVAHEVKNPLTPIKLSVQHIRRAWDDRNPDFDAILTRNADAMLVEIDRLAGIAKTFSRFGAPSGPETASLAAVDVGAVVKEMLALYGVSEGPTAFESEVEEDLAPARARVSELKEVLVNLLENARNATREGGRVIVQVRSASPGGVLLRVVDDGTGIPEELMPKVFEPHFSSRTTGTGLGLAIVRRLVESWGGSVSLGSSPDEGTVVSLHLLPWD